MAQPEQIRTQNVHGVKFSAAEAVASLAAARADVEQERLLIKYAKRTQTEKIVIKEIGYRIKDSTRGIAQVQPWEVVAAAELIYENQGKHLYSDELGKVRDERKRKRDRRKRSLTDKLKARMYEISILKSQQNMSWNEIIKYLKKEHRGQFYKHTITVELIRHIYYDFSKKLDEKYKKDAPKTFPPEIPF